MKGLLRCCWRVIVSLLVWLAILTPLQNVSAQEEQAFDITFEQMGYEERMLRGPLTALRYYFSLPPTWEPIEGGYVDLDLDYAIGGQRDAVAAFLRVSLNDRLIHTEILNTPTAYTLRVDLPPERLILPETRLVNTLRLEFEAYDECEVALLTSVTIRNSSILHLAYRERPLRPDLALYPVPIYQERAFEPGGAVSVLPAEPDEADLNAATMVAARLGQLTSGQLPISATLSSGALDEQTQSAHLLLIGRPDEQPLIGQLDLPLPLVARQLALSSQMPAVVRPGDAISYTLTVENTSDAVRSLVVEDRLPDGASLLDASPGCAESQPGVVRWEIGTLAPAGRVSATLHVQLGPLSSLAGLSPVTVVERTATLFDGQGNPLNVDTLSAQVGAETGNGRIASPTDDGGYFFVRDGQAVAEGDGLIQEIISPWSDDHVVVVVTGLDDAALLLAARALSSEGRFPGMLGDHAVIQAARPISTTVSVPSEDLTLAALGYLDDAIRSLQTEYLDYTFPIPPGWMMARDSYLALHIAHGVPLESIDGTLEVQLNDLPIGSAYLDASNATDSWFVVPLPATAARPGANRIRVRVNADIEYVCQYINSDRYWLTVYSDSYLHLPRQASGLAIDLANLPYPFSEATNMADVALLLPAQPTEAEVSGVLCLAARIGSVSGGTEMEPRVALGGDPQIETWSGYHIVAVGLPSTNAYLAAANDALPQSFLPATDEIVQEINRVIFRLPPGTSLGYLQELPSPWDGERAMLAVMGTTAEGLGWALDALNDSVLQSQLSGNLALIRGQQVQSVDTRQFTPSQVVTITQFLGPGTIARMETPTPVPPTATPVPPTPASLETPPPATVSYGRPAWLLPLLVVSALLVVVLIGFALWQARAQKRG